MGTGAEIALIAGLGALSAGTSFTQAQQANRARRQQNEAARQAAEAEQSFAEIEASERREEVALEQQRFLGTVRASSAARGASAASLEIAGISQAQESITDINTQLMMNLIGSESKAQAQMNRNRTSPLLAGLGGGISGVSTGLSISTQLE